MRSILLAMASLLAQDDADRQLADDPAAAVFVPDLVGQEEGLPRKSSLGRLVLLTDLEQDDDYWPVLERLEQAKKPDAILRYPVGKPAEIRGELQQLAPEFVMVVTRPQHIDINIHLELLELAASLDADPFVDFVFGYVTGATPQETVDFVDGFLKAQKKKSLPKSMIDFGPSRADPSFGGPRGHAVAKGWKEMFAYHGPPDSMLERRKMLSGHGIVRAGGHGMPDGVVDGLSGADLRKHEIDLSPALYFSGPCYCGVTSGWYERTARGMQRQEVDPMESFALAAIASGVTALFAGLDPDRGETTSQEMEHLWIHGTPLGYAAKETYDGAALALRLPRFELYRYEEDKPRPYRNLPTQMIGSACGRTLFGDPTWAPVKSCADIPVPVKVKDSKKSLSVTWSVKEAPTKYWMMNDVYHCDGGWTHRIQFRTEIKAASAERLQDFRVTELKSKESDLTGLYPTAMIERWGGKTYLHVYLVFPYKPERVFFSHRDIVARFEFTKGP